MPRARISVAGLMLIVLAVGLGLAALRNPSPDWASLAFTFDFSLLLTTLLGTRIAGEPLRTYCLGFSLFAGIYFLATLIPPFDTHVRPVLLTSKLLNDLYPMLNGRAIGQDVNYGQSTAGSAFYDPDMFLPWYGFRMGWNGMFVSYVRIGHCVISLIVGLVGVVLSRGLAARTDPDRRTS